MEALLLGKLNDLSIKLNTLFGERYKKQQEELYKSISPAIYSASSGSSYYTPQPILQQNITHVYNEAPLPIFPIVAYPSQTIIVNNPSSTTQQEKKKKEEDDITNQIVSVGGGVALSFFATWLFANDEYVNYGLSQVENEFDDICKLIPKEYEFSQQLFEFRDSFTKWKDAYITETKPKFYSKVGAVTSGFAGLGGLFMGSGLLIVGGLAGITLGGCYLLWKNLTGKYNYESSEYYNMMTTLNNLISLLNQKRFASSAPPVEVQGPGS